MEGENKNTVCSTSLATGSDRCDDLFVPASQWTVCWSACRTSALQRCSHDGRESEPSVSIYFLLSAADMLTIQLSEVNILFLFDYEAENWTRAQKTCSQGFSFGDPAQLGIITIRDDIAMLVQYMLSCVWHPSSVRPSIKTRYCIKMTRWIKLVFGMRASFDSS